MEAVVHKRRTQYGKGQGFSKFRVKSILQGEQELSVNADTDSNRATSAVNVKGLLLADAYCDYEEERLYLKE